MDLDRYRLIRESLLRLLTAGIEGKNYARLFAEAQKLSSEKEGLENLIEVLYSLLQDILHITTKASGDPLRNTDRPKMLLQVARTLGAAEVTRVAAALGGLEQNLRRNVSRQLSLEAFAIGLSPAQRS